MAHDDKKLLPNVKALCSASGMMIGSKRIDPHYATATLCKNGMIHVYCVLHQFKGFIGHPQILEEHVHGEKEKHPVRLA